MELTALMRSCSAIKKQSQKHDFGNLEQPRILKVMF